jgi:subtilisin family serine protease
MERGWLVRGLLAVAIVTAISAGELNAACDNGTTCPPTPPSPTNPPPPPSPRNNSVLNALGIVGAPIIIGLGITLQFLPENVPAVTAPQRSFPPRQPPNAQLPSLSGAGGGAGGGGGGGGAGGGGAGGAGGGGAGGPGPQALRTGFNLPPAGAPYVLDEVIADSNASTQEIDAIAARLNMTRRESTFLPLINRTLHLLHIDNGDLVRAKITSLASEGQMAGAQANFLFRFAQADQAPINPEQYAPQKLNLTEAHRLARGNRVLIAVIDSEVDGSHPDLAGAIAGHFEASGDSDQPHPHGTAMAGAIAAHRNMLGTAPAVGLLTVRAFSGRAGSFEGTTYNILKGLDWAAAQGARVINMSFAGPPDPRLREALANANAKGIVLVAAAGNAGPNSPPLFPAADPNVIAVTATNPDDRLFEGANRGKYISVAAPGVNILAPAPDGAYQFTTGTSVAAAEVSGVAALLLERNPSLTPTQVRKILMDTAKDLGPKGRDRDFGAGLVNALKALTAVRPR